MNKNIKKLKSLMIFFLLLPIEVFAERNISCDTLYGNFLYQAKDSKIDVFVSYADSAMYSIEIKSETDSYIYGERVLEDKEIQAYLFKKNNKLVTSVQTYNFNVPELLKEKYLDLRIKQTIMDSAYYGNCFTIE
ncbi:MAG: hypothetical protein CBC04_00125 [Verrucomicrobia bacterium TMED44]|nr:MAG: hypothetical protein CBC04_00125 [Verrucomicrobia bacterium TMED44]